MSHARTRIGFEIHAYSVDWSSGSFALSSNSVAVFAGGAVAWSHNIEANGGFDNATLQAAVPRAQAEEWYNNGVGRHIVMYDQTGVIAFEGFVDSVAIKAGPADATRGKLVDTGNRVSVIYTPIIDETTDPPLTGPSQPTVIAQDTGAQLRYGIFEKVISGGTVLDDTADAIRDTWLQENAYPKSELSFQGAPGAASSITMTLHILGYMHMLDQYVYNQTATSLSTQVEDKIGDVLDADPNSIFASTNAQIANNGLLVSSFENENRTASAIIREITGFGDASNNRYLFRVDRNREFFYQQAPTDIRYQQAVYTGGHQIRSYGGGVVRPWMVRPGNWIEALDFIVGASSVLQERSGRTAFIERVTFSAPYNVTLHGAPVSTFEQKMSKLGAGMKGF